METDRGGFFTSGGIVGPGAPSFTQFLAQYDPSLLPWTATTGFGAHASHSAVPGVQVNDIPHGTTIVALAHAHGVVMAGDRRATAGNVIAMRDIEKVFAADDYSLIGIAGSAGMSLELVRLFQVDLEHYEKIEGEPLSLEGKANRLATMLRGNLGLALQGLAAVPLFAGHDPRTGSGRIYSYDITGGRYEEHAYHSVGSGSVFARGSLKKLFQRGFDERSATLASLEALYDAADDDSATGGPDLARKIYPVVGIANADGAHILEDDEVAGLLELVVAGRATNPDGPKATMPAAVRRRRKAVKP